MRYYKKKILFEQVNENQFRLIREYDTDYSFRQQASNARAMGSAQSHWDNMTPAEPEVGGETGISWDRLDNELKATGWQVFKDPEASDRHLYKMNPQSPVGMEVYESQGKLIAYLYSETNPGYEVAEKDFGEYGDGIGTEIGKYMTQAVQSFK